MPGVTPLVVPNDAFYRIDTALAVPHIDVSTWTLAVTGMVDRPLTLTYDELLAMPLFEQYVTISCVSNPVGGSLVGNALWTGVRLKDVLAAAGVQPGATQIVGRSYQDFWAGFPTSWAMAPGREPMIAVGMNRIPLPAGHGFPARLIVPGLYGYVSATKWLTEIQLTTRDAVDGYWVPLGWAKDGPILTQSRIDVPGYNAQVPAGLGPGRRRRVGARSRDQRRSRSGSTTGRGSRRGSPPRSRPRRGSSGCSTGRPRPGATTSRSARRTARATSRPTRPPARPRAAPTGTTASPSRCRDRHARRDPSRPERR